MIIASLDVMTYAYVITFKLKLNIKKTNDRISHQKAANQDQEGQEERPL